MPNQMWWNGNGNQAYYNQNYQNQNQNYSSNNYYDNVMNAGNQQKTQQTQPITLCGRIVNSPNEITPNEVPMNGGVGIFPQMDGTCIYAKAWTNDGCIKTQRYVLEEAVEPDKNPSEFAQVMTRLDKLEEMLTLVSPDLKEMYGKTQSTPNQE